MNWNFHLNSRKSEEQELAKAEIKKIYGEWGEVLVPIGNGKHYWVVHVKDKIYVYDSLVKGAFYQRTLTTIKGIFRGYKTHISQKNQ